MIHRFITILAVISAAVFSAHSADPTLTTWSWQQCQGSFMPYVPPAAPVVIPDSLKLVMINHVGRHGARFPSSSKSCTKLRKALTEARDKGTLTAEGRRLLAITDLVIARAEGRWGALDSLGQAEQRGIAARMLRRSPYMFHDSHVNAISSYSPRCIMSMDEFTHQLARLDNRQEIYTSSGRQNSRLVRFFDLSPEFTEFTESSSLATVEEAYTSATIPLSPLKKIVGSYLSDNPEEAAKVVTAEWAVLTGLGAMGISVDGTRYFTPEEMNRLWSIANLKHYLKRAASTLSTIPADIASPLLQDLIDSFDAFIADSTKVDPVQLRFGHAETLMPLLSLMRLRGCYYLTTYFDTVGKHWCDFDIVPMAANLQMLLLRSESGHLYLLTLLNEKPMPLIPNDNSVFIPWSRAREYLNRCLPLTY